MHHHNRSSCKNNDDNTNSFHHSAPESIDNNNDRNNATHSRRHRPLTNFRKRQSSKLVFVQIHWLSFLTPTYAPLRTQRTCPLYASTRPCYWQLVSIPLRTYWHEILLKLYKHDQSTKYARYCIFFDTWHTYLDTPLYKPYRTDLLIHSDIIQLQACHQTVS